MDDTLDLLQVRIERAKDALPEQARRAIDSVDWKTVIFSMHEKKGLTIEQLGDLELETELMLCGLLDPARYPKEIESRLKISRNQADSIVNDMNEFVFKKIKAELIKITEQEKKAEMVEEKPMAMPEVKVMPKIPTPAPIPKAPESVIKTEPASLESNSGRENDILKKAGIEIMPIEISGPQNIVSKEIKPNESASSLSASKLGGTFKVEPAKTEYTLGNLSSKDSEAGKNAPANTAPAEKKVDPYRMPI